MDGLTGRARSLQAGRLFVTSPQTIFSLIPGWRDDWNTMYFYKGVNETVKKKGLAMMLALVLTVGLLFAVPFSAQADQYEEGVNNWVKAMEEEAASADHILGGVHDVDTIRPYSMTIILPGETVAVVPDASYNPQGIQGGIGAFSFSIFQLDSPEIHTEFLHEGSTPARTTFTELKTTTMEYPFGAFEIEGATQVTYVSLYKNETGYPVVVRGEHGPSVRNITTKSKAAEGGRSYEGYTTRQQAAGAIHYAPIFYFVEPYYEIKLATATADGTPYEWHTDKPEMTLKLYMDRTDHTYTVDNPIVPGRVFQRWEKTSNPYAFNIHEEGVTENGKTTFVFNMQKTLRKTSKTGSMSPNHYAEDGELRAYFYNESYTVRLHAGEGNGDTYLLEAGHDDEFTLNLTDYTSEREGYNFLGWCTDEAAPEETLLENATAENRDAWFPRGSKHHLDVYAVWEEALDYSVSVETTGEAAEGAWKETDAGWQCVLRDGTALTGWQKLNGTWYLFSAEGIMRTGWVSDGGAWYYFNDSGAMQTGWVNDGAWYYFNGGGVMQTGWQQIGGTWYYFTASGAMKTGWLQDGATWYWFDGSGAMATGTRTIDGTEYTFDASGAWIENAAPAQSGWVQENGSWTYYDANGAKVTGWLQDGAWYYFNDSGIMVTGWKAVGGSWYYFKSSGAMVTGWQKIGGSWYFFRSSGAMKTGWYEDKDGSGKSTWYWFDKDGAMATGWKEINGQWEMFADSGAWLYTWDGN